jgi:hypothetical protein
MADRNESPWRRSSRSSGGTCVEVKHEPPQVLIRNSRDPDALVLSFDQQAFRAFLQAVRSGEFDLST